MLANFMKLVLMKNNLVGGHYVEVYAGGAAVAWPLLFDGYVQKVHINDLNKSVYGFWRSVVKNTEELCRKIYDTPVTMEEWNRLKRIQIEPKNYSPLELGFSTFFLNRTNWSGIILGGVIGGKAQKGKWKLHERFNKQDLVARIQRIANHAKNIRIYNQDAANFIQRVIPDLPLKSLIYLDPPYFAKGQQLYQDLYDEKDHAKIAKLVPKYIKQPWIVSYDDVSEVNRLYKKFRKIRYSLSYSAQERYSGSEIMFFSKNLSLPEVMHPAHVKTPDVLKLQRKLVENGFHSSRRTIALHL